MRMIAFLNMVKYSVVVILLILVELGFASFIFFDNSWKQAANRPAEYDSDEEYIGGSIRQPLMNRPATGGPVFGTLDHRPSRNDA
ncbi:hypothetical protein BUALT_Bualt05G0080900 [Buddleja alternifolia]|uniref:Uncharacterized protein n=1 Tax=Buddleja alternifolia TaxID=168488 RepID=A0AAV6XJ21_9LAMI|nr:hypothetical protein BUALT_Bualt05G0080900 [Buddleja alternifolia]